MPKQQWTILKDKVHGGVSGKLLDGCEIRENEDGSLDFLAVLATAHGQGKRDFPEFAYQGLIWNVTCTPKGIDAPGTWANNAPNSTGEEGGTYTAQAGPGTAEGEDGKEDASSAYA